MCGYYFHFCYFCALQKNFNMNLAAFNLFLGVMSLIALIVFVALYFVKAGYGIFRTSSWGTAISNKLAWILMEAPVFLVMCVMWMYSERRFEPVILTFFLFFQLHYFQRAFIFPLLLKGKSKMPLAIMSMGILFNLLNGYMQGEWIFYLAPATMYQSDWFTSPYFIIGTLLFFTGMLVNWSSDYIIRHLRKPGDTRHYLPQKGMYRYVTSANYFGEIVEWAGWAILTCSASRRHLETLSRGIRRRGRYTEAGISFSLLGDFFITN